MPVKYPDRAVTRLEIPGIRKSDRASGISRTRRDDREESLHQVQWPLTISGCNHWFQTAPDGVDWLRDNVSAYRTVRADVSDPGPFRNACCLTQSKPDGTECVERTACVSYARHARHRSVASCHTAVTRNGVDRHRFRFFPQRGLLNHWSGRAALTLSAFGVALQSCRTLRGKSYHAQETVIRRLSLIIFWFCVWLP